MYSLFYHVSAGPGKMILLIFLVFPYVYVASSITVTNTAFTCKETYMYSKGGLVIPPSKASAVKVFV